MPPKKKAKKTTAAKAQPSKPTLWLVTMTDNNGYGEDETKTHALYDSLEKAKAGGINLMDAHSPWAKDWRNGLAGLGREDEDNYVGFEYTPNLGAKGGELVSNEYSDGCSHKVTVSIKQLEVNPSPIKIPDEADSSREREDCGFIF